MPIPSNPSPLAGVIGASADVLPIPAQDYTDPTQNGALNYATGWPSITSLPLEAGGKAPRREYFNALAQLLSSHIFFLQSGNLYPWNATLNYLTGAHVLGSDGNEYIAQKSNGPDVPDSSAVDPVDDASGTWLSAVSVYTETIQDAIETIQTSVQAQNQDWIGVPRPWRSTTLPANYCWANGDFVSFADWPELEQVYEAGGFAGMLMAWNADGGTQAANLGKWRPDAAQPTGLYTPNLTGQFFRNWGPGADENAGTWQDHAMQQWYGMLYRPKDSVVQVQNAYGAHVGDGGMLGTFDPGNNSYYYIRPYTSLAATTLANMDRETRPVSVWQPVIIYLGQPAA